LPDFNTSSLDDLPFLDEDIIISDDASGNNIAAGFKKIHLSIDTDSVINSPIKRV
jgi:hypothetical protein